MVKSKLSGRKQHVPHSLLWTVSLRAAGGVKTSKGVVSEEIFSESEALPDKDADLYKMCRAVSG